MLNLAASGGSESPGSPLAILIAFIVIAASIKYLFEFTLASPKSPKQRYSKSRSAYSKPIPKRSKPISTQSYVYPDLEFSLLQEEEEIPYVKQDSLFTPAERTFLVALQSAVGDRYHIFGKVRLADVIKVSPVLNGSNWQKAFNQISAKHLDFVACNPSDLTIAFAVELDDSSHAAAKRQQRDQFLNAALRAAAVPLHRFPARRTYNPTEIQYHLGLS